jgi:hypothetical protein
MHGTFPSKTPTKAAIGEGRFSTDAEIAKKMVVTPSAMRKLFIKNNLEARVGIGLNFPLLRC